MPEPTFTKLPHDVLPKINDGQRGARYHFFTYEGVNAAIRLRLTISTCAQQLTSSQLNLPHGTEQKRIMKKLKPKNGHAQKKRSGREVRGVSSEAGRESMVGKICERGRS